MKYFIKLLLLICICASNFAAQDDKQWVVRKYVEAPKDIVLQVTPFQSDSPVKFEDVRFLYDLEGGFSNSYELRNVGTKPIRSVTVASTHGTRNTYARKDGNVLIMPGERMQRPAPKCEICIKEEIVPLTNELREKFDLKGEMKAIIVLMVTEVEFMDGTKFTDQTRFDKAEELIQRLGEAFLEQKQRDAKKP